MLQGFFYRGGSGGVYKEEDTFFLTLGLELLSGDGAGGLPGVFFVVGSVSLVVDDVSIFRGLVLYESAEAQGDLGGAVGVFECDVGKIGGGLGAGGMIGKDKDHTAIRNAEAGLCVLLLHLYFDGVGFGMVADEVFLLEFFMEGVGDAGLGEERGVAVGGAWVLVSEGKVFFKTSELRRRGGGKAEVEAGLVKGDGAVFGREVDAFAGVGNVFVGRGGGALGLDVASWTQVCVEEDPEGLIVICQGGAGIGLMVEEEMVAGIYKGVEALQELREVGGGGESEDLADVL